MPADGAARADRARLAAEALAAAKADARARGDLPAASRGQPAGRGPSPVPARTCQVAVRGGQMGPVGPAGGPAATTRSGWVSAIGGLLDDQGWQQQAAIGSVFGRWAEIVGADLAAHTGPTAFADGELAVTADSTAWATQVRLLAPQLVRRLNAELGDGTVRRVKVRGPAPPRQRGGWRVPGRPRPARHVRLRRQDGPGCRCSQVK